MTPHEVQVAADSLVAERTVDIVTTGRRSGQPRTTEIWTTVVDGEIHIAGTPGASHADVEHQPRDWLANLLAEPAFTLRLKQSVHVELPARATPVTDPATRRAVLEAPCCGYYREWSTSIEQAVELCPMVHVTLTDGAAAVEHAVRASGATSPEA